VKWHITFHSCSHVYGNVFITPSLKILFVLEPNVILDSVLGSYFTVTADILNLLRNLRSTFSVCLSTSDIFIGREVRTTFIHTCVAFVTTVMDLQVL
jgi:hypothetical protein